VNKSWLSVLIPVYNVRPYLAECLASVLQDGIEGVEVLMLEDCSTDGSDRLAAELAARHAPQVRLLRHAQNGGLSAARNTLLDAAQGDYVWFLDSDDLLLPGSVRDLQACLERFQAPDLVLCDFRTVRERFQLKHRLRGELHFHTFAGPARTRLSDRAALLRGAFDRGHLHSWSKIARRELWEGLRFPVGRYFEDMATTPALLLRARSYVYMDSVWVGYRQRAGSILASNTVRKVDDMMAALAPVPALLAAQLPSLGAETDFAAGYYAAKTFVTACRFEGRRGDPARLAQHLQSFEAMSPLAPAAIVAGCRARGWWWRALRVGYWLGRATAASKAS
jgi:hypothetical protein